MESPFTRIYPHIRDGRFYNNPHEQPLSFLNHTARAYIRSVLTNKNKALPSDEWIEPSIPSARPALPTITWIGHSTFLIQIDGITILTDPVFGPLFYFYKRLMAPGIAAAHLPRIDYVLISHNHRDHMDAPSLTLLRDANPALKVMVPLGNKAWFVRRNFKNVIECNWWDKHEFEMSESESGGLKLTFLPAIHWSQRGLFDKNRTLWGSWMITTDAMTIYFAGDTAYSSHFSSIGYEFPSIDIALMPIGPCEPRQWLQSSHVGPEEAGQGFIDLEARQCIPMHWGTFGFGIDSFDLPLMRFKNWWSQHEDHLAARQLHTVKAGQQLPFSPQMQTREHAVFLEQR